MDGIDMQNLALFAAIGERREQNVSAAMVEPCYRVLGMLELQPSA